MHHCRRFMQRPLTRRDMLTHCAGGMGMIALTSLLTEDGRAAAPGPTPQSDAAPRQPRPSHFAPQARRVIFLYMDGGVSQVDSFDPKPQLAKEHGQPPRFQVDATVFNNNGNLLKSACKPTVLSIRPHCCSIPWICCRIIEIPQPVKEKRKRMKKRMIY